MMYRAIAMHAVTLGMDLSYVLSNLVTPLFRVLGVTYFTMRSVALHCFYNILTIHFGFYPSEDVDDGSSVSKPWIWPLLVSKTMGIYGNKL
jgi:hypothetical protein